LYFFLCCCVKKNCYLIVIPRWNPKPLYPKSWACFEIVVKSFTNNPKYNNKPCSIEPSCILLFSAHLNCFFSLDKCILKSFHTFTNICYFWMTFFELILSDTFRNTISKLCEFNLCATSIIFSLNCWKV
jgi:hypothetical protein